jgi:hypothetical protein
MDVDFFGRYLGSSRVEISGLAGVVAKFCCWQGFEYIKDFYF